MTEPQIALLAAWWLFGAIMIYRSCAKPGGEIDPAEGPAQFTCVIFLAAFLGGLRPIYEILAGVWWLIYRWQRVETVAQ